MTEERSDVLAAKVPEGGSQSDQLDHVAGGRLGSAGRSDQSLTRRVIGSISWLAVSQIAQRASAFVITALLARLLSPVDFGLVAFSVIALGFVTVFADLGLTSAIVQRQEIDEELLDTAFWANLATGVVAAAVTTAVAPLVAVIYHQPRVAPLLAVMSLSMPIAGVGLVANALLQRRLAFREIAFIEWGGALTGGIVGVVLAASGAGAWALVAQSLVGTLFRAGGFTIFAGWMPRPRFRLDRVRAIAPFSASVLGGTVVNHAISNVDNILIGLYLGPGPLGYYSIAYSLVTLPGQQVGGLVTRVMFPALSSMQHDLPRFRRAYLRTLRIVACATFPLICGLAATAPVFVGAVYGAKWGPAVPLVQVLAVVGIFEAVRTQGLAFWAMGRADIIMYWALGALIVMLGAFGLGLRGGILGVAWSYAVVGPVLQTIAHVLVGRFLRLPLWEMVQAVAPPALSAGVMAVVVFALVRFGVAAHLPVGGRLAFLVAAGAVLYTGLMALLGWRAGQHLRGAFEWVTGQGLGVRGAGEVL